MSSARQFEDRVNGWRTRPLYTITEASRLAEVSPNTVRRWLEGYETQVSKMPPVFGEPTVKTEKPIVVSFLQLAEVVVVSKFRTRRVTLRRVREAHRFARDNWEIDYPFARLSLATDGIHVLRRYEEVVPGASLLVMDAGGQWTLPGYVAEAIQAFDFVDDLAAKWFPVGKDIPIVIDPQFSAGMPTIPSRRVTIQALYKRWTSGHSIKFIAEDLQLRSAIVESALRCAQKIAA